jgi:hypothetical protein
MGLLRMGLLPNHLRPGHRFSAPSTGERRLAHDLTRRFVLAYPLVDDLPQEAVSVQFRYLISTTSLGRTQWTRESTSGDLNGVERGGATSARHPVGLKRLEPP